MFNAKRFFKAVNNDYKLGNKLLFNFSQEMQSTFNGLTTAFERKDLQGALSLVAVVKISARNVLAEQVENVALELEQNLKAGKTDKAMLTLFPLREAIDNFSEEICFPRQQ